MDGHEGTDHVQNAQEEDGAALLGNNNDQGNNNVVTCCNYWTIWDAYRSFVRDNRTLLELLDAGLSRILFWTPTNENMNKNGQEDRQHREIFYGILSLHRLAMDTALQHQEQQQQDDTARDDYGTTVRPNPADNGIQNNSYLPLGFSPTTLRMALTILQSLLPTILELSSSFSSSSPSHNNSKNNTSQRHQRARVRLYIERVKFAIRLTLLASYWKRLWRDHSQQQERDKFVAVARQRNSEYQPLQQYLTPPLSIGLLTNGGLFHGSIRPPTNYCVVVPTLQQEHWEWQKHSYVGRRTGRKVTRRTIQGGDSLYSSSAQQQQQMSWIQRISSLLHNDNYNDNNNSHLHALSVVMGELMYAYRPLYWAATEAATEQASYRSWTLSVAMDLVSLQLLCLRRNSSNNGATQMELKRRKMRLLLYLLRAPIWDNITGPLSERVGDIFDKVPVLGRLMSTYLRDWLCYMKHPYVSEEG
jgi:Peroxisomal membrane protein (Pex16)